MTGGSALDEQGRRLTLAADLTWRAQRCAREAQSDAALPDLARRLAAIGPPVERAHRVRFDPPYPGAGAVEDVRGGRRLALTCRAFGDDGVPEAVVFTTLIGGRAPQVNVGPAAARPEPQSGGAG